MVCPRCIDTVTAILKQKNIAFVSMHLGRVQLLKALSPQEQSQLIIALQNRGFELLQTPEENLLNGIKTYLIEKIHYQKHASQITLSRELAQYFNKDYSILSKLFSRKEGMTIEKYVMYQKIERAKELLSYNEMSISEIAFELQYSSTAHFSNQFKKVTGISPSRFKKNAIDRKTIDNI